MGARAEAIRAWRKAQALKRAEMVRVAGEFGGAVFDAQKANRRERKRRRVLKKHPVLTLAKMSAGKRAEMQRLYGRGSEK
jgi:hypothetical protein